VFLHHTVYYMDSLYVCVQNIVKAIFHYLGIIRKTVHIIHRSFDVLMLIAPELNNL
jgi:hypothetical protein